MIATDLMCKRTENMPMQRLKRLAAVIMLVALAASPALAQGPAPAAGAPQGAAGGQRAGGAPPRAMTLTTTAWPDGDPIPAKYTQAGEQVSPPLTWTNTPPNTVSFVLHMLDPDVARNKTTDTQVHWLVWNIPGTATGLPEGVPQGADLPDGSRQISATGPVYRGPGAPATGPPHHYTFEIYALDTKLDVAPLADAFETRAAVMKAMQGHILGKAVYVGLFRRPQ
jgi:Raf kinase inhibitor-like YbhB/YbcL family protein